ncbi:MAG: GNAT family acetyltransferase [Fibrobacteres bacterium]|nr:GNAT family acetyltransferase [Fibrobacterota bacterium]
MPNILIREYCNDTDKISVITLWRSVFGYYDGYNDPETSINKKLNADDHLFFVATMNEEIVGTVMAGYDGHRGWIYSLAVDPDSQKRGIGRQLVDKAESALKALGCPKLNLQILDTNNKVIGFYEKLGFKIEPRISMGKVL